MWVIENYKNWASLGVRAKEKLVEEQTAYQKLEIYDTEAFGKVMTLDGSFMFSEKDEFVYHEMMAHPALCTHKNPKRVLIIGGGDGGVVREVLKHEGVSEITLCEIDERVTRLSQQYFPMIAGALTDPKVKLIFDDGIKYIEQFEDHFDLIITDSTDPVGPAVSLFQEDYYRKVKKALKSDGCIISQTEAVWLPHDIETLRGATEALCNIFKHVQTYMANVPLYQSGFVLTFASDHYRLEAFDQEKSEKISKTCQYYNPSLHIGSLALPTFVKEIACNQ